MKKLLLTVVAVTLAFVSFSQQNFLPGYVNPTKNDTIRGYIDYRNWKKNPGEVIFKKSIEEQPITFKPADINVFGVADEVYESAKVEIEVSPDGITDLSNDSEFRIEQDHVFLQTVVKGEKSLYYLLNRIDKHQFYVKHDSEFELLKYKLYVKSMNYSKIIGKNKQYVGQLTGYLNCPTLKYKISGAQYNRSSLEKLFASYYKETGKSMAFEKKAEKAVLEISALAGVTLTSLKFSGGVKALSPDFGSGINPVVGASFDMVFPRNQRKWSLINELILASYELTGESLDYTNVNQYDVTTTTIGGTYLKLNTMVRFKFPVGKMFVFANFGISNAFMMKEINESSRFSKFYSQEKTVKGEALDSRKYEQGLVGGIGAGIKRWSLQVKYETSNGMSSAASINSSVVRYYFQLGYRLK
jgi:hypothetical protein